MPRVTRCCGMWVALATCVLFSTASVSPGFSGLVPQTQIPEGGSREGAELLCLLAAGLPDELSSSAPSLPPPSGIELGQ